MEKWVYSLIAQIIGLQLSGYLTAKLSPKVDKFFESVDSRFLVQNLSTAGALITSVSILWANPIHLGFLGSLATFLMIFSIFFMVGIVASKVRERVH